MSAQHLNLYFRSFHAQRKRWATMLRTKRRFGNTRKSGTCKLSLLHYSRFQRVVAHTYAVLAGLHRQTEWHIYHVPDPRDTGKLLIPARWTVCSAKYTSAGYRLFRICMALSVAIWYPVSADKETRLASKALRSCLPTAAFSYTGRWPTYHCNTAITGTGL